MVLVNLEAEISHAEVVSPEEALRGQDWGVRVHTQFVSCQHPFMLGSWAGPWAGLGTQGGQTIKACRNQLGLGVRVTGHHPTLHIDISSAAPPHHVA